MRLTINELLANLGLDGPFYWGKRLVRGFAQPGSFKSHSIVANWVDPHLIRVDLRAGLSGKTLDKKDLAQYPLQLQTETFFEFSTDEAEGEKGEKDSGGKGRRGGGAARSFRRSSDKLSSPFEQAHSRAVAAHATLSRGVVMGMEIGKNALEGVFKQFCAQVAAAKVLASDLLAAAGKAVTRYTPPPFMSPRGDEQKVYKYNRAKNETMFGIVPT
jgi:hypothetical protein